MYTVNKIETFHPAKGCRHGPSRVLVILCLLITTLLCQAGFTNTASAATYYLDAINRDEAVNVLDGQAIAIFNITSRM